MKEYTKEQEEEMLREIFEEAEREGPVQRAVRLVGGHLLSVQRQPDLEHALVAEALGVLAQCSGGGCRWLCLLRDHLCYLGLRTQ